MVARKCEWADLQKAELGRFTGSLGQANRKLDFDGNTEGIFARFHQRFKNRGQRKHFMFEHGRETYDTDTGPADAVVYSLVIDGISGANGRQRAIGFGCLKAEAHLVQMARPALRYAIQR